MPESPVADEVDDDVVAELLAVREREADRGERRLGVVGVHVDDRHVEALREVARVARRAPLGGIGREADLVVGDDVQRPAGRVAVERVEVEGLGDDALPRERSVAVDEDRQGDGRVVDPGARRAVGLLRPREPLDDRVDGLEVARVRGDGHLDLARGGHPRLRRGEVVLHVARPAFLVGDERVDRALALELAQDRRVGAPDGVREDVEPAAMRDADQDLVRARLGGELDRLVEHRHEHVETLDRELLLADERAPEVRLEALDLREPLRAESAALLGVERPRNRPDLDRLAQPDALGVVGDVLDLVRDRARVDLAEARQRLEQRLAGDREPQQPGGDARLQLGRERRLEPGLVERRVAHRLRSERIEAGVEVAVHAVRLDERHRGRDAAEELVVGRGGRPRARRQALAAPTSAGGGPGSATSRGCAAPLPSALAPLDETPRPGSARGTLSSPRSKSSRHAGSTASGFSRYCSRSWPT